VAAAVVLIVALAVMVVGVVVVVPDHREPQTAVEGEAVLLVVLAEPVVQELLLCLIQEHNEAQGAL
jgi:hypothetical protein